MADGLSIAANVIAIITLAYSSSKSIYETINSIHKVPKAYHDLNVDLDGLQQVLASLKVELDNKGKDDALSKDQRSCLKELQAPLKGCAGACKEFQSTLSKIFPSSSNHYTSIGDRFKLQFQKNEIAAFQIRIVSYKSTLTIALGFTSFKSTSQNIEATKALEHTIEESVNRLSGQMQGIEIAIQTVRHTSMAALSGVTQSTGNVFKYVRAFNDAKQLVGNIGEVSAAGPTNTFDVLIAQDRAKQIAGSIEGRVALDFMNA